MAKITPISGFPEWLPEQRLVESRLLDQIRATFESFGFAPIETRAVEPIDWLLAKGETDKEIYVLRRIHDEGNDAGDARLGLHFDLTIPLARYVLQNRGHLAFPFKRYQIQKVWRGERPQEGRFREFYQADLDVVGQDTLPLHYDAEMPRLLYETLSSLPIPPVRISINNRKVLEGVYRGLGIDDIAGTLRIMDKLDKIGEAKVGALLRSELRLSDAAIDTCLALGRITSPDDSFVDAVRDLGESNAILDEGLNELAFVMQSLTDLPAGSIVADLHIARGLDYYTGTVYETALVGHESLGSICSGGRYDNLASEGSVRLPGVGVSIGVTRLMSKIFGDGMLSPSRAVPTCVLVAMISENHRSEAAKVATSLRQRGIACEVHAEPVKFGKQIKYADRRGIPFVWFPPTEASAPHEVKDIRSGEQAEAHPDTWTPPGDDLHVRIERPS